VRRSGSASGLSATASQISALAKFGNFVVGSRNKQEGTVLPCRVESFVDSRLVVRICQ
jgi:hypothetical protein